MTVLVVAEHDNQELKSSTANTITAATQLGEVTVLVAGHQCRSVASHAAVLAGVSKVLLAESADYEHGLAEELTPLVVANAESYSYFLAPATTFGKNLMPRIAARLDVAQISDIISIEGPDTFKRPIYAGSAIATVKSSDNKKVVTVRSTAFDPAPAGGNAPVEVIPTVDKFGKTRFVSQQLNQSSRPELTSARIIVAGGRALGSVENFNMIEQLADRLGAAIGASRAAVDAGYAPNDYQIGQTGKIVAPDLYIGIGISGAIQHLAGMKDSKVIVAINKDEDAPIFEIADYGMVGDLFEILPELIAAIE